MVPQIKQFTTRVDVDGCVIYTVLADDGNIYWINSWSGGWVKVPLPPLPEKEGNDK